MEENKFVFKIVKWSVIGLLVLVFVSSSTVTIKAGHRGIILKLGAVDRVLDEGFNFKKPFIEKVEKIEVRTTKEEIQANSSSKDLQAVSAVIALNFHLQPESVGQLWSSVGGEYKTRIIDPAIQEAVKSATAKYTAEELITKRQQVKDDIKLALSERLIKEFILVDEVSIVNFDFSNSFNTAIEAKVTAEQDALAAKNKLEQVKFEADQRVAQAQAEAEAIRIQAQAIQNQGGAEYVQLQAIEKWNGVLPNQMIPGSTVPFINLN